jgi:hypothetical protein
VTLVETIVAAAIIAIVAVSIVTAFTVILNSRERINSSKADAESVESQIAHGEAPASSVDLVLRLPGGFELKSTADTYTDGQFSYTVLEGTDPLPPVVETVWVFGHGAKELGSASNETNKAGIGKALIYTVPKDGYYRLETWGARGGDGRGPEDLGGKGGYAAGTIWLSEGTELYLQIGGGGIQGDGRAGGYNGGGDAARRASITGHKMSSGGGGTDIRILADNIYNRLIVAGGGGGSGDNHGLNPGRDESGGNGGGAFGGDGSGDGPNVYGRGATQSQGGASGTQDADPTYGAGKFFQGGSTKERKVNTTGGGAGGGWYGGGAGTYCGAGGGSGWVFTAANFNAWNDSTNKSKYVLDDYGATYYLSDAINVSFGEVGYVEHPGGPDKQGGFVRISLYR